MKLQAKWEAISPRAKLRWRVFVTFLLCAFYVIFCVVEQKVENELRVMGDWRSISTWRIAVPVVAMLFILLRSLIWRKSDEEQEAAIAIGKGWKLFFRIAATLLVVLLFVVLLALNPKEVFGFVLAIVGIVTIVAIWSDARLSR
jgi:hypothetical protein